MSFAVERGDGEGLAVGGGHALEDGLGGGGEGVGGGVGVGEREHAWAEGVAGAVVGAGEAELGEGVEAAADGGAGEAGAELSCEMVICGDCGVKAWMTMRPRASEVMKLGSPV